MDRRAKSDAGAYPVPFEGAQVPGTELLDSARDYQEAPALKHYFEILFRRKKTIFLTVLVLVALGVAVTLTMTPTYIGQASVEVTPHAPKVTKFTDVINDSGELDEFTRTQVAVFQSNDLATRVIKKLNLVENPDFNPFLDKGKQGLMVFVKKAYNATINTVNSIVYGQLDPVLLPARQMEVMNQNFAQNLSVLAQLGTNVITIGYSSSNRQLAQDITNAVVQEYSSWQIDRRIEATRNAKGQLEKQIGAAQKELENSQGRMSEFAKQSGIVSLESKSNLIYVQLEEINQSLAKVEADRISKGEFFNHAKSGDINELSPVLQNTLIQQLKNEYIGLKSEYEKVRVSFQDDYPAVQTLKAKMVDLGKKLDVEQKRILKSIENDLRASEKTEAALKTAAKDKKVLALQVNELAGRYKTMDDQVNTNRQIYQSLLGRAMEIDANVATDVGNIKIVNMSALPIMPYKPKIFLNLAIALVLGFAGGTGLALLLEHNDSTIKRTNEISELFALPVIGVIPLAQGCNEKELSTLVLSEPDSIFSEGINFAKASIELSSIGDSPKRSLLITSMNPGEGKSTVAANLAHAFAASGQRVLLIDADLTRGRLAEMLSVNGDGSLVGLTGYLNGTGALSDIVRKTGEPNLFLLPSGPHSQVSWQLLGSSKMANLLQELLPEYDRIILDGPPFGANALVLGKEVDGLLLVATLGSTSRESLRVFRRTLNHLSARLLGVVINRLNMGRYSDEFYCQHYRTSYGGGKQKKHASTSRAVST